MQHMKNLLIRTLLLAVVTVSAFAVLAPQSAASFFNDQDIIWDANASSGQVILKAKYKESPENGLMDQSFEGEVKNIGPGISVNFSVNGFFVGSAVSDAFGTARLNIDILGLPDDGTGRVAGLRAETGDMVRAFRGGNFIEAPLVLRP